ncbi:MAG: 3-oxoacyl-[acyl-carrier-protein] synthase [Labilithrix sp.]|nr:3-oxoacyl-[acyl-carrier-protein] synthase [Labilithrix sp.]
MIVVTGLGAISSLGGTAQETWQRVLRGERAFRDVSLFPADDYRVRLVAQVDGIPETGGEEYSRTSELGLRAAREALVDAGLADGASRPRRVGLVVGGSTAGMLETESTLAVIVSPEGDVDPAVRDEALSRMLTHPLSAPTDRIAHELGPFSRVRSLSSACSSGANALLVGATWLELGLVDVVLCGAADALCRITLSGFNALGALDPDGARPFDRRRHGLTLGEGAGFLVLERADGAARRGKDAICTLLGWAARAEAHHITNPEPSGEAPVRAMRAAIARAGLTPADIDYVNAHGTGTPLNEPMEARALGRLFGADLPRVPVSSQKGQIGHTLAASGAIEAAITALALATGTMPPTGGLDEPDPDLLLRHVRVAEAAPIRAALSSSFAFGGMDTALVLGKAGLAHASPPRRTHAVVVTGAAALTPAGLFDGAELAALPARACAANEIGDDVSALLDGPRARRLDRASRLAAVVCERALGGGDRPGVVPESARDAGVILGNAFGSVDGTSAFMRRLREKGARLASPADFPALVPSSPAGFVSIYLGLTGPTLAVADLAVSGECAFAQGYELIAAGEAERAVVVAVEERSRIVDQVLRVVFGLDGTTSQRLPRREGAGAIALASAEVAEARGLPVLAVVEQVVSWAQDESALAELAPPPDARERALVVLGVATAEALLERSGWALVPRVSCAEQVGSHEGAGGIALAVASATLASDTTLDVTLCIGSARGWGYAILLRRRPS